MFSSVRYGLKPGECGPKLPFSATFNEHSSWELEAVVLSSFGSVIFQWNALYLCVQVIQKYQGCCPLPGLWEFVSGGIIWGFMYAEHACAHSLDMVCETDEEGG